MAHTDLRAFQDVPEGRCRLEPAEHGTLATSYHDWSRVPAADRERFPYPRIPESALRATLGILARTVER